MSVGYEHTDFRNPAWCFSNWATVWVPLGVNCSGLDVKGHSNCMKKEWNVVCQILVFCKVFFYYSVVSFRMPATQRTVFMNFTHYPKTSTVITLKVMTKLSRSKTLDRINWKLMSCGYLQHCEGLCQSKWTVWFGLHCYSQLSLRQTRLGPAPTVHLREVSALEGDAVNDWSTAGTNSTCLL